MSQEVPVPPRELAEYVGDRTEDPQWSYVNSGRAIRADLERLLPVGWAWDGKRVLDFGCGSGRVLRHFLPEARDGVAEFHGVDIHGPSVAWFNAHLNPPIQAHRSGETPPLPFEDASFDLIWSTSVFSHLTDHWAAWMAEMHRVLEPGGLFIVSFMSEAYNDVLTDEPWEEDRIGMTVLGYGHPWEAGGPMVLHSEWWIRAHWGRAFEIDVYQPGGFVAPSLDVGQGVALLRKRPDDTRSITAAELEALEPDEPREIAALTHALKVTQRERAKLDREYRGMSRLARNLETELDRLKELLDTSRAYRAANRVHLTRGRLRRALTERADKRDSRR